MTRASDLSFAVYLAHPLVLEVLLRLGLGNDGQRLPAPVATGLAVIGTAAGAAVVAAVARRSRWSLALTGRPRVEDRACVPPSRMARLRNAGSAPEPVTPVAYELDRRVTEPSQVGSRP